MGDELNWDLVEDTIEKLMTEDGTFAERSYASSHPTAAIKSKYGFVIIRKEASFAAPTGEREGALAIKLLAIGHHPEIGVAYVPLWVNDYGEFAECVYYGILSQFHLYYLAFAGCLTSSPGTLAASFSLDNQGVEEPWMAHTGRLIASEEGREVVHDRIYEERPEFEVVKGLKPFLTRDPFQKCYVWSGKDEDGKVGAKVLLNDKAVPELEEQLARRTAEIFRDVDYPMSFQRAFLFVPGVPAPPRY